MKKFQPCGTIVFTMLYNSHFHSKKFWLFNGTSTDIAPDKSDIYIYIISQLFHYWYILQNFFKFSWKKIWILNFRHLLQILWNENVTKSIVYITENSDTKLWYQKYNVHPHCIQMESFEKRFVKQTSLKKKSICNSSDCQWSGRVGVKNTAFAWYLL